MDAIGDYVRSIRLIDSHEHLDSSAVRKQQRVDFFRLFHYLDSDLASAGLDKSAFEKESLLSVEEKARLFLQYWTRAENTSYARAFRTAMEDLYGMEDWSVRGIVELSGRVAAASDDPGWYDHVLRGKAGIDLVLTLVQKTTFDNPMFRSVMYMDEYCLPTNRSHIRRIEEAGNRSIYTLQEYLEALHTAVARYAASGVVGLKFGYAYWRTLRTDKPTFHEAETAFNRIMRLHLQESLSPQESKALQDYLIHEAVRASIDYRLPIQIHTGHHDPSVSRNGNWLTHSRAAHLIPLLLDYPEARFVLLHASLPYTGEYLSIARNFPNVYADMSWVYLISPSVARQLLHQMIEMVPQSKIIGFGGDYLHVEGAYAHAKLARQVLAGVLREKIEQGYLTEEQAMRFAKLVLRDNPISLYSLDVPAGT